MRKNCLTALITGLMIALTPVSVYASTAGTMPGAFTREQAGIWSKDASGKLTFSLAPLKWRNSDGSYASDTWAWLDPNSDGTSECYYFDAAGALLQNTTTPDGYTVNSDGAWVQNGIIQTRPSSSVTSVPQNSSNTNSLILADGNIDRNAFRAKVNSNKYFQYITDVSTADTLMIELVNKLRARYGLSQLTEDPVLMAYAAVRANEMQQSYSHIRPDGTKTIHGENLTDDTFSPGSGFMRFYCHYEHRANMLIPGYTRIGVAWCNGYWVQNFA